MMSNTDSSFLFHKKAALPERLFYGMNQLIFKSLFTNFLSGEAMGVVARESKGINTSAPCGCAEVAS